MDFLGQEMVLDSGVAAVTCADPFLSPREAIVPGLTGVSETMLWSLHNRACEASRADSVLSDPAAISIHRAIDYDFTHHFGEPGGSLAARAAQIDAALREWLAAHPDGTVVSLGEGLETQSMRVDNGRMRWLTVDLPDAITLRECFILPTARFRHLPVSALSPEWMEAVDPAAGVCVVAQGLLMYFPAALVEALFRAVARRFPDAMMVFDTVPRWFSRLTMEGLQQTPHYRLPPMPWGIDRDEIEPRLRGWSPGLSRIEFLEYRSPRGVHRYISDFVKAMPVYRHEVPCLVRVQV
jgi:O-methyltransferase involved in polyketide biosynthesis